jgi:intracellular multiplication protein IcmE
MNTRLKNISSLFQNVRTRTIILITITLLLAFIIIGVVRFLQQIHPDNARAQLPPVGEIESVPGGLDSPSSPEYIHLLEQQNIRQAKKAEKTHRSAIPTIVDSFQISQDKLPFPNQANCCCIPCEDKDNPSAEALSLHPSTLQPGTLVYNLKEAIIGMLDAQGKARDKQKAVLGQVGPDGLVWDGKTNVVGSVGVAAVGMPAYDHAGRLIGTVDANGNVIDAEGNLIGRVDAAGRVRDENGAIIGRIKPEIATKIIPPIPGTPAYDHAGRLIGTVDVNGNVIDAEGNLIGRVDTEGKVRDTENNIIGEIGETAPGRLVYDAQGHIVGTVGAEGIIRDSQGKILARLSANGQARDEMGSIIGSITPPVENTTGPNEITTLPAYLIPPVDNKRQESEIQVILDRQAAQISEQKAELLKQQMHAAMSSQIGQLFNTWGTAPTQQAVEGLLQPQESLAQNNNKQFGAQLPSAPPAVKAGTIMYAVLMTRVNSDEPGPVLAHIVEGKFKGARLMGNLSNLGDRVLLQFDKMNLPAMTETLPIKTVAIDQHTARTALSSMTDHHLISRYGSLFVSSILQDYGKAVQQSGAQIVPSPTPGGLPQIIYPALTPWDKLFVGLGTVGSQMGTAIGSQFNRPPTVHVYSGAPIGILFIEDLPALPVN